MLNHFYWVSGSVLGGILGDFITFDTTGLWFVMEALFVVIFLEQWKNDEKHQNGIIGICVTALCLITLGKDSFLLASMIIIFSILYFTVLIYKKNERKITAKWII